MTNSHQVFYSLCNYLLVLPKIYSHLLKITEYTITQNIILVYSVCMLPYSSHLISINSSPCISFYCMNDALFTFFYDSHMI